MQPRMTALETAGGWIINSARAATGGTQHAPMRYITSRGFNPIFRK